MRHDMTKAQFIRMLKAEGLLPLYMTERNGRRVLDRVGNDSVFADLCDAFGYGDRNWTLTHKEGGQ